MDKNIIIFNELIDLKTNLPGLLEVDGLFVETSLDFGIEISSFIFMVLGAIYVRLLLKPGN